MKRKENTLIKKCDSLTVRMADLILVFLALIAISPLFLLTIFVLSFTGEKEVFYRQRRIGKNYKPFHLLKFATMLKNSPNVGTGTITTKNDPRVLPVGKLLRKTKINELPQLINVIKGDMSLVGPRPLTENNFNYYSDYAKSQIVSLRPGLSGLGSIVFRDEEGVLPDYNPVLFYKEKIAPYKADLESWFVRNYSIKLYITIIILTIMIVVRKKTDVFKWLPKGVPERPDWLK